MPPLVTVIATVYKRTEYLAHALKSVRSQNFDNFEVIVADDSGTASAQTIVAQFSEDPRFIYQSNPQTLGVVLNIRQAIEKARGKYLAIINDDDLWEPGFLSALIAPLEAKEERVLAFSDHWIIDTNGQTHSAATHINSAKYGRTDLPEGEVANLPWFVLEINGVPLAMASLFRKDALDLNYLVKEAAGSYDFWISCLLASTGKPFYYVPQRLTRYRVHRGMETGRRSPEKALDQVYIFKTMLERNLFPSLTEYLQGRYNGALFRVGRDHLLFDKAPEARNFFRQALKVRKEPKSMTALVLSYTPLFVRKMLKLTN